MSYGTSSNINNIIVADQATNVISSAQLDAKKINRIHATVLNAVVTLPANVEDFTIWVHDAVEGGGNITVNQAV
jgi:hypothetical protein